MKLQTVLKESVALSQVAARIRELARDGAPVRFTWSAHQRMEALRIHRTDVLTVLKKCRVTKILGSSVVENLHYRVQGNTVDEKGVVLRVRIEEPPNSPDQLAVINVRWLEDGGSHEEEVRKVRVVHKNQTR
jgi:hypothetical protein